MKELTNKEILKNINEEINFLKKSMKSIESKIDGIINELSGKHSHSLVEDFSEHWLKEQILKGKIKVKKWKG